jgi:hypothetical protein
VDPWLVVAEGDNSMHQLQKNDSQQLAKFSLHQLLSPCAFAQGHDDRHSPELKNGLYSPVARPLRCFSGIILQPAAPQQHVAMGGQRMQDAAFASSS